MGLRRPASTLLPAPVSRGTPSLPLELQLPPAGSLPRSTPGPAALQPGTPSIPLYEQASQGFGLTPVLCGSIFLLFFFFKKHENCFTVEFIQRNLSEKRTELPPCSSAKSSRICNFTSKGAKGTHEEERARERRAGSTDLALTPTALLSGNTISLLHKDLALSGKSGSLRFSKCGKMLGGPQQESMREAPARIITREGCSARGSASPRAEPKSSC